MKEYLLIEDTYTNTFSDLKNEKLVVTFFFVMLFTFSSHSQQTAPPLPSKGAAGTGYLASQNSGGGPIGGGLFILLGLGTLRR